ncbi:cytochrome b5-like [Anticarsia gemmatalis]|uniref:cytochrome b5-like n=1 Tax=Anticarsia gemmatalis TaxID=129554 RepID=UPI003F768B0F
MSTAKYTRKELEVHNHRNNAVIIIDNVVYDVSEFLDDHPGGVEVLLDNAGKDASQCFHEVGHSEIALEWRQKFVIGEVVDEDKWEVVSRESAALEPAEPLTLGGVVSVWGPPVVLALLAVLFYAYLFP